MKRVLLFLFVLFAWASTIIFEVNAQVDSSVTDYFDDDFSFLESQSINNVNVYGGGSGTNYNDSNWTQIDTSFIDLINSKISSIKPSISIDTSPVYPEPNSEIGVMVTAYSIDLDRSKISWSINGLPLSSGVGIKKINLKTGNSGDVLKIKVDIEESGNKYTQEKKIILSSVDIINEPDTYVTPFYRGAKNPSSLSANRFIAITNLFNDAGKKIEDKNIVFTWRLNGSKDVNASGTGKNTYTYTHKNNEPFKITVIAEAIGSNSRSQKIKVIKSAEPKTLLYEITPSMGEIFDRAIKGDVNLVKNTVEIKARPIFFPTSQIKTIKYLWYKDAQKVTNNNLTSIMFEKDNNAAGLSQIMIITDIEENPFVESKSMFNIVYNKTNQLGF